MVATYVFESLSVEENPAREEDDARLEKDVTFFLIDRRFRSNVDRIPNLEGDAIVFRAILLERLIVCIVYCILYYIEIVKAFWGVKKTLITR